MRHRLCEVMASMPPAFEAGPGCPVEADETPVPDSLSGNHSRSAGFPCPAPHAGAGATGPLLRAQMGSGTYLTSWRGLWRQPYPFHPEISMS